MSLTSDQQIENKLLAALPVEEYESLKPYLEPVSLALGDILFEPPELIRNVYFPTNSIISFLTELPDGDSVEVGLTGKEGIAGVDVVLGIDVASKVATVQGAGDAFRLSTQAFKEVRNRSCKFQQYLLRYAHYMMSQISFSVLCNTHHKIEGRLARWLLMYHDRIGSDEFYLTHEFMANMLGIRRASVSIVAKQLRDEGYIDYQHGRFRIIDREGLVNMTCKCYPVTKAEFDSLYRN
jgi:CRP-like cAMP-binding protein